MQDNIFAFKKNIQIIFFLNSRNNQILKEYATRNEHINFEMRNKFTIKNILPTCNWYIYVTIIHEHSYFDIRLYIYPNTFFMHVNLHVDIPILHDIHCVSCKKYLTYRNRRTSQYDQYFETISVCTKAYFLC